MTNRITDTFIIQNLQVLSESKSDGMMKIKGVFQRADEENNNKRVYPKQILEREVKKAQDAIKENRFLGELDHPEYNAVKLMNVSHKITSLQMNGNDVIGEAVLLNTPAGKVAQDLIKGGVSLGISSRGLGSLTPIEEGRSQVNEDYKLVCFDLVADPSTKGAYPSLTESTEISRIVKQSVAKVQEEQLLVHLLKERLVERDEETDFDFDAYNKSIDKGKSITECIKEGLGKQVSIKEQLKELLREEGKGIGNLMRQSRRVKKLHPEGAKLDTDDSSDSKIKQDIADNLKGLRRGGPRGREAARKSRERTRNIVRQHTSSTVRTVRKSRQRNSK